MKVQVQVLNLIQGTPEWLAHRVKCLNASEAAAMLGISKYQTRSDLLKVKATGVYPEVDAQTQMIFDQGHKFEALARPIAEKVIGEELYPAVYAGEVDGLMLSASLDGITMLGDIIWEHKSLNDALRAALAHGTIPGEYHPQIEQGLLLTGAEKCLFTASNGEEDSALHAWYESDPALRKKVLAGWKQFQADVAEYQHVEQKPAPVGSAPEQLPALHIEVTGMVTASNLEAFKAHALAVFDGIKTDLQTDEDFADAERTVKWCKGVEDRLDAAKQHALSQTASIDELFRAIDAIREEARQKRLTLDRLVKTRKDTIRVELVQAYLESFDQHVRNLNNRLGCDYVQMRVHFGDVIRGKKTVASCREALEVALANAKIEASQIADVIDLNRQSLDPSDWPLLPDFRQICTKDPGDFARLLAERRDAEQARIQAAIAAKEAAKQAAAAAREEQARRQAEQEAAKQSAEAAKQPTEAAQPPEPTTPQQDLAKAAVAHEEAKLDRAAIKLRTQIALSLEELGAQDLMKVLEFICGLKQRKAA